jgi:ABC-2 type transport system permease protein
MIASILRFRIMTLRVLKQLRRDRRFLALSIVFPVVVIYFIKVVFDVLASPMFDISIYIVPYAAFIIHFITFILTAIVLVRERVAGTLTQMFVSGYRQIEIIGGYLLGYTVLATIQSLLLLFELNWLFDLSFDTTQMASMYLVIWLLAIISMVIGMLVSNFARNEGQVFPFIPLILLSVILSGIIVSVDKLPEWAQVLSYATPLYYANEVLQELIHGGTLLDSWINLVILPVYGLIMVGIAALSLREKD